MHVVSQLKPGRLPGQHGGPKATKQRFTTPSAFLRITDIISSGSSPSKSSKTEPQVIALQPLTVQAAIESAHQTLNQRQAELKDITSDLLSTLEQNLQPICVAAVFGGGLFLGLTTAGDPSLPSPVDQLSSVCGWTYFLAWGLSFYPQVYENWKRQSVEGLSFDYIAYSLIGFLCYAVYTTSLTTSPTLQLIYSSLHYGHHINVNTVDLFHAYNALFATGLTLLQFRLYGSETSFQLSSTCKNTIGLVLLSTLAMAAHTSTISDPLDQQMHLLSFMYALSYIKVGMTVVSYLPQAIMNWKRKSTDGWNMGTVYLDLTGGVLCNLQVMLVCLAQQDWSAIAGNPVKTAVGSVSIVFDFIFFLQHFVLYKQPQPAVEATGMQKKRSFKSRKGVA